MVDRVRETMEAGAAPDNDRGDQLSYGTLQNLRLSTFLATLNQLGSNAVRTFPEPGHQFLPHLGVLLQVSDIGFALHTLDVAFHFLGMAPAVARYSQKEGPRDAASGETVFVMGVIVFFEALLGRQCGLADVEAV